MINDRQIKILYPPLILLGSLLIGDHFDKEISLDFTKFCSDNTQQLVGTIIGGGILVLVLGYIIGTITIAILRCIFICNKGIYEVDLKKKFDDIKNIISAKDKKIVEEEKLYAVATFDNNFLSDKIHEWIQRRWSSFYTSANSATSLFLSVIIGPFCLKLHWSFEWVSIVTFLTILYICHARRARRETIEMIDFQTKVKENSKDKDVV